MYIGLHVKYLLFLSGFNPFNPELNPIYHLLALLEAHHFLQVSRIRVNEICTISADFRKILIYQISLKFFQWEPGCSIRMERRTDRRDEANSRFSQFCETSLKMRQLCPKLRGR